LGFVIYLESWSKQDRWRLRRREGFNYIWIS